MPNIRPSQMAVPAQPRRASWASEKAESVVQQCIYTREHERNLRWRGTGAGVVCYFRRSPTRVTETRGYACDPVILVVCTAQTSWNLH